MCKFKQTIEDYNLSDLGFIGDIFTWSNKHEFDTFTKERLDRVVVNSNWVEMFDLVTVEPLVTKML